MELKIIQIMLLRNLLIIAVALSVFACGGAGNTESESTATSDSTAVEEETTAKEVPAVSVWDKVSVRDAASEDGKWLTSLSLGETLTYLGEEQTDKKDKTYLKVRLNDGTEGWSRTEFVIPEAEAGVFVNQTDIYNRPDLLTKSDDQFSKMDIVAIKNTQDDWAEIVGKPTGEKWLKSGWVKASNLSKKQVDIAMAKFAKPVLDAEGSEEKVEKLEEVLNNQDLTASAFTPDIKEALDELKLNATQDNESEMEEADSTSVEE